MVSVHAMVAQIRQATSFMSGEQTGKGGRAVGVKRHGESLRIALDTGSTATWQVGKDAADDVVMLFGLCEANGYSEVATKVLRDALVA